MLASLKLRHFALIEEIHLQFEEGFTVISGETGAGKSILIEGLGLLAGGRAASSLVRTGAKEAEIEGVFETSGNKELEIFLEDAGLADGGQLIIRRLISTDSKGRIFANGRALTLGQLNELGAYLIDLSGQHDSQVLLHAENHGPILDSSSPSLQALLQKYADKRVPFEELRLLIEDKKASRAERLQKADFLRFQSAEIEKANILDPEEEEKLLSERGRAKNADQLFQLAQTASSQLEDHAITLSGLLQKIQKLSDLDASLQETEKLVKEANLATSEALRFFDRYGETLHVEPGRLDFIESRLYQLEALRRKYGASLAEICKKGQVLKNEIAELTNFDGYLEEKGKELESLGTDLLAAALALSKARQKWALELEKKISHELKDLSLPKVVFKIAVDSPVKPGVSDCGPRGIDQVRMEFSANPGENLKPLAQVASGGELSRILLAIKKVLGSEAGLITFIFDEIDTGIGGAVAEAVGKKLKEISKGNQVFVVTHLAQVASHASHHFVIEKEIASGRTKTGVRVLDDSQKREQEIARMLGGVKITDTTLKHAREMLQHAKKD